MRIAIALWAASAFLVGPGYVRAQIPPGYEVIRLTDDPDFDDRPAINNYGQVVWSKRIDQDGDQEEIFFWDGVQVRRITDNNVRDANPDINDHGTMVWSQSVAPGEFENFEIAMLHDGRTSILTDNNVADFNPSINNLGNVAWSQISERGCFGLHIMCYDGLVVRQISDDQLSNQVPMINNRGQIAWVAYDFCVNPWLSTIKLFSNGQIIALTAGTSQDQPVALNDRSQVAWGNGFPEFEGILLWDNGNIIQITDSGNSPDLGENGSVGFSRWNASRNLWEQWLFMNDQFRLISDPNISSGRGRINRCGEVSWNVGEVPNFDTVLMRLSHGDANHDGVVDLSDATALFACLTGPGEPKRCKGPATDLDQDGDVDMRDFALHQGRTENLDDVVALIECMTGPIGLDEFCACRTVDTDHDRDVDLRDFASFQTLFRASP